MGLRSFLFSFEGRINRAKYWLVALVFLIGGEFILMKSLFVLADNLSDADPATIATLLPILFYAITYPLFAVSMWIYAATTIKRLHDRNKSGWWIVPFFIAPILLGKVGDWLGDSYPADFLMLVMIALSLWGFVEMLCLRGTRVVLAVRRLGHGQ